MSMNDTSSSSTSSFEIQYSLQGRVVSSQATLQTTAADLVADASAKLDVDDATTVKLLYKGKRLNGGSSSNDEAVIVFPKIPTKTPKFLVLVTQQATVAALNAKRSDPTIRGFDQEEEEKKKHKSAAASAVAYWGPQFATPHKEYKFCKLQPCTWQSFGHRPTDATTPHAFAAQALLERLATDPGIQAVLQTRELVVGTLGEMDPIDDRLMQKKQQQQTGNCLLGYNTNAGQRIDIKLRTDDLKSFRPYTELAATLLHELSHNWVGEHNVLFWTNYAQMRSQYLYTHVQLRRASYVVQGQTTAQLAGLSSSSSSSLQTAQDVHQAVMQELTVEMRQHGLHPSILAAGLQQHVQDLERKAMTTFTVGSTLPSQPSSTAVNARELALQAAERRKRNQEEKERDEKTKE